jgi:hypothetical protein
VTILLERGALLGLNDFKKTGYGGPCPPIGRHALRRVQHRCLHTAAVRLQSRTAPRMFRPRRCWHGPRGVIGNIVWLLLAGWWLALGHLVTAILLAVTVIGIPFAWAHLKLAGLALWPIGKAIVPVQNARLDSKLGWR